MLPLPQFGVGMSALDGEQLQGGGPQGRLGDEKSFGG